MKKAKQTYSPSWAPHVVGEYEQGIDDETGAPERTVVHLSCGICKDTHKAFCDSGAPRGWILKYATVHVHRDPLNIPRKENK